MFLLLVVLVAPEKEVVDATGNVPRPLSTAAVVKEDETWGALGTIAAMTIDDTISSEVIKNLEPTCTIIQECIPLQKGRVESVCVIKKFLKVFQGNLGSEGRALQILEEAIKTVGPEASDYVARVRYIS